MIVGTLLPPDQDGGFFRGDLNLHAPIISETAQEIHEKYGFVSCQPSQVITWESPDMEVHSKLVLNEPLAIISCLLQVMKPHVP